MAAVTFYLVQTSKTSYILYICFLIPSCNSFHDVYVKLPRNSCTVLLKGLEILPLQCKHPFSLMNFHCTQTWKISNKLSVYNTMTRNKYVFTHQLPNFQKYGLCWQKKYLTVYHNHYHNHSFIFCLTIYRYNLRIWK